MFLRQLCERLPRLRSYSGLTCASGICNCVGEAINPVTGRLGCSTNERDNLGNYLVPDYVTSIQEGGFYGWPWYYMGGHEDPRLPAPCANGTGPNRQAAALTSAEARNCARVDLLQGDHPGRACPAPHGFARYELLSRRG